MADNNSYLNYEGLTVYDNKIKTLINGKFTNTAGTFAGTASKSLDSSKLNGHAASYFSVATHTHDSSYLGKTATAANALKLGGVDASVYAKTVKIGNTSYNATSNIVSLPAYPTLTSLGAASSSSLTTHTGNTTLHVSTEDRAKWNKVTGKADSNNVYTKDEIDSSYNELNGKITAMGNVFKFKGSKASKALLPTAKDTPTVGDVAPVVGDVWHVDADKNEYVYVSDGSWELIGSAHTQVTVTPSLTKGVKVCDIDVDGNTKTLYAPTISVSQSQTSTNGTKIADVSFNGSSTAIYAPTVSITQNATSGIKVGTIQVGATSKDLYITDPNTDSKVKHTVSTSSDTAYPILMAKANLANTEDVYHNACITATPSGRLNIGTGASSGRCVISNGREFTAVGNGYAHSFISMYVDNAYASPASLGMFGSIKTLDSSINNVSYIYLGLGDYISPNNIKIGNNGSLSLGKTSEASSGYILDASGSGKISKSLEVQNLKIENTNEINSNSSTGRICLNYSANTATGNQPGSVSVGSKNRKSSFEVFGTANIYGQALYVGDSTLNSSLRPGIMAKLNGSTYLALVTGGNELSIVNTNTSDTATQKEMHINHSKASYGNCPTLYRWETGNGDDGAYASHIINELHAKGTIKSLKTGGDVLLVNGEPMIGYKAGYSFSGVDYNSFGNANRGTVIGSNTDNLYHGTNYGKYKILDENNTNIAIPVNLLRYTDTPSTAFTGGSSSSNVYYKNTGDTILCQKGTTSANYYDVKYKYPLKFKNSGTYIISFYIKADAAFTATQDLTSGTGLMTHLYNTAGTGSLISSISTSWDASGTAGDGLISKMPITTSWQRVWIRYQLTSSIPEASSTVANFILFRMSKAFARKLYVANIQIEEGATATEWSSVCIGDLAPKVSDMCDLGTGTNSWKTVHANAIHLGCGVNKEHTGRYGGIIYFGDAWKNQIGTVDEDSYCYIGEISDDHLKIYSEDELTLHALNDININSSTNNININGNTIINYNTTINGKCTATHGFYDTSDIRKKNVKSALSLDKCYDLIDKCQEIIYTLKDEPDKERVGMIAQEVECFFPEIVNVDKDGYKSLDYSKLVVICLRLLKDIIDKGDFNPNKKKKSRIAKLFSK